MTRVSVGGLFERRRSAAGFTLIEVMAALMIFSIITLGLVPLIAGSIRASARARAGTVGKNVVVEAIEHVRGLPYFVSLRGQRVDVLDFYYPDATSSGYSAGFFTVTCNSSSTTPACAALEIPPGYTLTFRSRFVTPSGTGYSIETPLSSYNWDWDTVTTTTRPDVPPTQLLEMTITASWRVPGATKSFTLPTLIGAKPVERNQMNGIARIDYAVRLSTVYDAVEADPNNLLDDLIVTAGITNTTIGSRLTSTASHTTTAATGTLVRRASGGTPAATLAEIAGAADSYEAPPDEAPAAVAASAQSMGHPDIVAQVGCFVTVLGTCQLAGFDATSADQGAAGIAGDLPNARGRFVHAIPGGPDTDDLWIDNQRTLTDPLGVNNARHFVTAQGTATSPAGGITGDTRIDTGALAALDRRVQAQGNLAIRRVLIGPATNSSVNYQGYVVRITNFTATMNCNSTTVASTARADASWSATLQYWNDRTGTANDNYTTVNLTGNNSTPQLVNLTGNNNPVVIDRASGPDIYLFEEPDANTPRRGYLSSWSSNYNISQAGNSNRVIQNAGRVTTVNMNNAITIVTSPRTGSSPSYSPFPNSGVTIDIGKMSCRAEDLRP